MKFKRTDWLIILPAVVIMLFIVMFGDRVNAKPKPEAGTRQHTGLFTVPIQSQDLKEQVWLPHCDATWWIVTVDEDSVTVACDMPEPDTSGGN